MPNGEGTPDPRYKVAHSWRFLLLGMLAGTIRKNFNKAQFNIIEVNEDECSFTMETPEGNFKVKVEVSF